MKDLILVSGAAMAAVSVPIVVDASVKGSVILLSAGLVAIGLRKSSAATRHLVWVVALVGLLSTPALSVVMPKFRILPTWLSSQRLATAFQTTGTKALDSPVESTLPGTAAQRAAGDVEATSRLLPYEPETHGLTDGRTQ